MKKIKDSHVLVIGSGPSIKKYWNKIENFINNNNLVIFGCNYVTNFIIPDYHFWGSTKRLKKYGKFINKKSVVVTSEHLPKNEIRKYWKGKYKTFKIVERRWKRGSENKESKEYKRCRVYYKNGKMFGCFYDISSEAIFYAYVQGASKITVVGNDGYTLYPEKDLDQGKESQHCYGEGHTDGYTYQYCKRKDWDKYRTLNLLYKYGKKRYGFGFKIITPTIYDRFYDSMILNIENNSKWQKWKEPKKKEYKKMYVKYLKNRKIGRDKDKIK